MMDNVEIAQDIEMPLEKGRVTFVLIYRNVTYEDSVNCVLGVKILLMISKPI